MEARFHTPNEKIPYDFVEQFRDSVFQPSIQTVPEFFKLLARVTAKALGARHVNIWDNNVYGQCLVHLANYPELKPEECQVYQTMSREHSITGLAVARCDVVVIPDLTLEYSGRRYNYLETMQRFKVNRLVSIPIFNVFDSQLVTCVVNLYYGPDDAGPFKPGSPDCLTRESMHSIDWLSWSLGTSIHYLLLRVDKNIRAHTEKADARLRERIEGLPSTRLLFQNVLTDLQSMTLADEVTLFLWKNLSGELIPEAGTPNVSRISLSERNGIENLTYHDRCLLDVAKKGVSFLTSLEPAAKPSPPACPRLAFMATPILSKSGEVLGVIRCTNAQRYTFSTFNIFSLETFAKELAPHLERLLRLREDSMFASVIKQVFAVIARGDDLDRVLQETIETIVDELHAETGSIYLKETKGIGGEHLIMRAGATISKPLVGKAEYKIGVGITGTIAERKKVVRFNTIEGQVDLAALNWAGKYDEALWPGGRMPSALTYLGVPILQGDEVLGVWKVENIVGTDQHPDPFFTEEDGQMALIVSSFLAYVIANQREHYRSRQQLEALAQQSLRLADSTIKIEEKRNEPDAVLAVLDELKTAGWSHAMVSLYDPRTHSIKGVGSSWPDGELLVAVTDRSADSEDILAHVLRTNMPVFIADSTAPDSLCDQEAIELAGIRAQFVVPMVVDTEKIGTLQVDMEDRTHINDDDKTLLIAFAKHLAIAISRIRSIRRVFEMTENIVGSARFVAAEEMAALTVHSLKHRLNDIIDRLTTDLNRPERRQNTAVREYLEDWLKKLIEEKRAIDQVLTLVKAGPNKRKENIDVHATIQKTLNLWINYLHADNCRVQPRLHAEVFHTTHISARSFGEILAVLLVNSIQAHARRIEIRTSNAEAVRLPNDVIPFAICIDVADDGQGLGANDPEEIFEATFTTKNENEGTGLGLYLARRLARNAGGDLIVAPSHSFPRGVTFRLILPLDI